jgi:hypothetical protein
MWFVATITLRRFVAGSGRRPPHQNPNLSSGLAWRVAPSADIYHQLEQACLIKLVKADCGGNIQIFQHPEALVSALIFRDVGRRLAEPICDHRLRKAGCLAACLWQLARFLVTFDVNDLWQSEPRGLGPR